MIETDAKQVLKKFASLNSKKQKAAYKEAYRKASNILVKETRKELKTVVRKINTKHTYKNGKTESLSKGIKAKVYKDATGANVHILGDYRLKFFEIGTKPRYVKKRKGKPLKKRGYRGSIKASHFFRKAQTNTEDAVFKSIDKNLSEAIIKQWNK